MKTMHQWVRTGAILTAGMMILTSGGCGSSKAEAIESASTQEQLHTEAAVQNYAQDNVILPDNFDNMYYPLESVIVERYVQGFHYYPDGKDEYSFWFSMAVLSSLLVQNECVIPEYVDNYCMFSEEDIQCMASTLYADYAKGKIELAEISDDNPYVYYDEESHKYGLLSGNVGELGIRVRDVQKQAEEYTLDTQLIDLETNSVISEYQVNMEPREKDTCGLFDYSITGMTSTVAEESEEDNITQEDALELAQDYMEEGQTYAYKRMIMIGSEEYYDFAVQDDADEFADILVCIDGSDVLTGIQNSDGSWTID